LELKEKMRIGISIDGVLRDLLGKVGDTFDKYFPQEWGDDEENFTEVLDYDLEKWLNFPEEESKQGEMDFDLDFDESTFMEETQTIEIIENKNRVTVDEFLYEKCTLEVFGYAGETIPSAVETLNNLILENPEHEFILISREGGLAIPSTLFFLSKTKSICSNIKFVTEYSKVWDHVDVMITDHPKILNSKPTDKFSIVVDKDYNNKIVQSGIRIKTIKEVDKRLLDNFESVLQGGNPDWVL
jgi:hypothetical protein